jgi:hypothetical protein
VKRLGLILLAAVCVLLQTSLLPALRPFGVVPNLALAMVVLVGLEGTASMALTIAVLGGFALDLASGTNFGLWTGVLTLAALVAGLLHRAGIELGGGLIATAMVTVGTLVTTAVVLVGLANTVMHWPIGWILGRLAIELVLNLILTLLLRPVVRWLMPTSQPEVGAIG